MSGQNIDLVIERLVLEGVDLIPEQAETLARLIEGELASMLAEGNGHHLHAMLTETLPRALSQPPDLPLLARALAGAIASRALGAAAGHA